MTVVAASARPAAGPRAAAAYLRRRPWEALAYGCDAATAVLVVAVQDIAFKQAMTACAALSLASLAANARCAALGQRVIFPKAIDLMIPAICVGLAVPAWWHEEATHRAAFLAICGTAFLTMLAGVLLGRSFAMEYYMDWYPPAFWHTPLVQRLTSHLAWAWIAGQAIMAASGAVTLVTQTSGALYVLVNYVMQLVPLAASVLATVMYPKVLKRRWGYDADDPSTGYPPGARPTKAEALAAAADAAAARSRRRPRGGGAPAAAPPQVGGGGGALGGSGSRLWLLNGWWQQGVEEDAGSGAAAGSSGGNGNCIGGSGGGEGGGGEDVGASSLAAGPPADVGGGAQRGAGRGAHDVAV